MLVRNVRWVGVATEHYAAMVDFLESTVGLQKKFEEPTAVEFTTVDGDAIQVMAAGDPYFEFFRQHAAGPVPLFEVDDVHQARLELESAGVQLIGELGQDRDWEWIHFRAPDGNLYEMASRRRS
jgi:hypothetical protein